MNENDKNDYYDLIIKNMTRLCHNRCYSNNEIKSECVSACYHKYINTISKIEKMSQTNGVECRSEFIKKIYEPVMTDLLETEYIFPQGGKPMIHPLRLFKYMKEPIIVKGINPYMDKYDVR
jgi:hypothetical protein